MSVLRENEKSEDFLQSRFFSDSREYFTCTDARQHMIKRVEMRALYHFPMEKYKAFVRQNTRKVGR